MSLPFDIPQSAIVAALLAGLVGGLHCLAMCGGFVAAVSASDSRAQPLLPRRTLAFRQAIAHLGRLGSYAAAGALAGGVGGVVLDTQWSSLQRSLYLVANLLLIALALALALKRSPFTLLETAGLALYRHVMPAFARRASGTTLAARLALGALWGMTPCALVYGVLPLAMFAGSAPGGALVMLAFGFGTLPNLALAGMAMHRMRGWLERHELRYAAAIVVAAFGVMGLYRVLLAPGTLAHGPFCLVP